MIYAALAVIIFVLGAAAGVRWHVGQDAIKELDRVAAMERETLRRTDKIDTAAVKHEVRKAEVETVFRTIEKEVDRVVTKIEYRDAACLDADGLRVLGAAIAAANPASGVSAPAVPASGQPRRWFSRSNP